ncbi:MAG: ACP S-malonyltransferase [Pseudomonadota bacterium]
MKKRSALIVAPGRGTYNKDELGYLRRYHPHQRGMFDRFDEQRVAKGQTTLKDLDGADRFSLATMTRGDNASALIYACAYADFTSISEAFEIVAVSGNSMGWYIALACAGALSADDGFRLVNTMGTLMQESLIGGQMIYPFVDEEWRPIPGKREALLAMTRTIPGLELSIDLGGMIVFGGDEEALEAAEHALEPVGGRFPMRLANHAAFHTRMQNPVAERGRRELSLALFDQPAIPLVDGRGHAWFPKATDVEALYKYTLGHQVVEPYNFSASVKNAVREFAPDVIIVLGPGTTLGGSVAQSLIQIDWRGLSSKQAFIDRQAEDPLVLSMGMPAQRMVVTPNQ